MKYQKAITFSYDDGIESDRKLVEILNRYGMKCTFNLNTGIQSRERLKEKRFAVWIRKLSEICMPGMKLQFTG